MEYKASAPKKGLKIVTHALTKYAYSEELINLLDKLVDMLQKSG